MALYFYRHFDMNSGFFYKRRYLYITWLIWIVGGLVWTLLTNREDAILWMNNTYNGVNVPIFTFLTRLAEWIGFVFPLLYLVIFKSIRVQLGYIMVAAITLIFVWFFKHIVFPDAIRPIVYLESLNLELANDSGVPLNRKFSFPSGHTSAGFAYFFFIALIASRRRVSLLFLGLAMLVGISRVFLAQHFVTDVIAGSILGVLIASSVYYLWIYRNFDKRAPIDKTLWHGKG